MKKNTFDHDIISGYSRGGEDERLFISPGGIIERIRTESILRRHLPKPPAVVYDIGGGTGAYAFPLAQQGYTVHLIDIVPLHIQQATIQMQKTGIHLAECSVGDARNIQANDSSADVVLLFGPLYHIQEKNDRVQALHEAYRILKPGGILFAVAVPRFAIVLNYGAKNELGNSYFAAIAEKCIKSGIYADQCAKFFTSAYFHDTDEFEKEVQAGEFKDIQLLLIEGPVRAFTQLQEIINDKQSLNNLLHFLELIETDRSIMGASGHIMAIGKK